MRLYLLPGFQFRSSKHHPGEEAAGELQRVRAAAAWPDAVAAAAL